MLPVQKGKMPGIAFKVKANKETALTVELRKSSKSFNHTPDVTLATKTFQLASGVNNLLLNENLMLHEDCYVFVCCLKNEEVEIQYSEKRITGIVSVFNKTNPSVSNYGRQEPPNDIGVESFEFWVPERRPEGHNMAIEITPALKAFAPEFLKNGLQRPVASTNAWVAAYDDRQPMITIGWDKPTRVNRIELSFDADYDNPLETVLIQQPERVMPFCVDKIEVLNCSNEVVAIIENNHLSRSTIKLKQPVIVQELKLRLSKNKEECPVSLFEVRCYNDE
jgi:hypothetical protein